MLDAIGCAKFYSRSHDAVIRVYAEAGNVIDKRNYHLFRPMLYQVATGLLSADQISGPLRIDPEPTGQ